MLTSSILATLVLLVMVVLTGGVQSPYVGYLVIPRSCSFSGERAQMLILAAVTFVGLGLIVVAAAVGRRGAEQTSGGERLMLATVIGTCAASRGPPPPSRARGRARAAWRTRAQRHGRSR